MDGVVLPGSPEALLVKGSFHRLPTVVGMTKDEGAFFYRCKYLSSFTVPGLPPLENLPEVRNIGNSVHFCP